MFETYRMLGEQHEAELVCRAEVANVTEGVRQMKRMRRARAAAIAAVLTTLAACLFATGVWAGSGRDVRDDGRAIERRTSFWSYDPATGNPTGPAGQPDFWNYDPVTGRRISDYSPGVAPHQLAALWSVAG